jgi:glycosyltransferase involved in cell wall biosynthesis
MMRVSVVIPAHNAASTLEATIASVLNQTHSPADVFVIDDGSSDATPDIARAYGSSVTCLSTPNRGVSAARNTGIAESRGELMAFLDADDMWEPTKLERQVQMLDADSEAGISTTAMRRVDGDGRDLGAIPIDSYPDACEALLLSSMVLGPVSSALVRRGLVDELGGFDTRFSQCADWDFFLRAALRTRFAIANEPLVAYRSTGDNMSANIGLLERDTLGVLQQFFSTAPSKYQRLKRKAYSNHWMILSGSYLQIGERGAAVRCLAKGLRLNPANASRALGLPMRRLRRARNHAV